MLSLFLRLTHFFLFEWYIFARMVFVLIINYAKNVHSDNIDVCLKFVVSVMFIAKSYMISSKNHQWEVRIAIE